MRRFFPVLIFLVVLTGCSASSAVTDARIHAFYYPWYGTPEIDGQYRHWAHDQMGDVEDRVSYVGAEDIGADYYPQDGCYSSNDPVVLARHMEQLKEAGVGSLSVSWWGEGSFEDEALPALFDAAAASGLKVSLHLEPLPGRDARICYDALKYYFEKFGNHSALYRNPVNNLPLVFVYDSYMSAVEEWQRLLKTDGDLSIRETPFDCVMIGLWVEQTHGEDLLSAGFDGVYSYFATDGFTYGSTVANWPAMAKFTQENGMLFVPCVGPGYADLRIRPWNTANQRGRENGEYYRRMTTAALAVNPQLIGLTSFNEWHEGTQIEPAQAAEANGFTYRDYGAVGPDGYLHMTKEWIAQFPREQGSQ